MPQKVHYQDDLFLLSVLAKSLESGLAVEADPEYFRDRMAGDIFFLDGSIRSFHGLLSQNEHLIDRAEYLKLLERTASAFVASVERLISGSCPMSAAYEAYAPQFRALLEGQRAVLAELDGILAANGKGEAEVDLVSQDELSELLRG